MKAPRFLVSIIGAALVGTLASPSLAKADTTIFYCFRTAPPNTVCTTGTYALKIYNEHYVNGNTTTGPAIDIYELDQYGNQAFTVNGRGYVYLSHGDFYARSYCGNRSLTSSWYTQCSFVRR